MQTTDCTGREHDTEWVSRDRLTKDNGSLKSHRVLALPLYTWKTVFAFLESRRDKRLLTVVWIRSMYQLATMASKEYWNGIAKRRTSFGVRMATLRVGA
jgi:hypothetical protein